MGTTPELSISIDDEGGGPVVTIVGEVDMATEGEVRRALVALVEDGVTSITVDMGGVSFLDSSGLYALLEPMQRGATVTVRRARAHVRRVLEFVVLNGLVLTD